MRDEASLARLEEMGFAVYVPRGVKAVAASSSPNDEASHEARARVVLLAREDSKAARALVAGVRRALAFARIESEAVSAIDESRLGEAKGLVAFGDALARDVGARVSAARQAALAWVATGDAAAVAGEARAKRALWSELRRLVRTVRAGSA